MSGFVGVVVDPSLQSQFSKVELRNLKSKYLDVKKQNGKVTYEDLPPIFANIKSFSRFKEEEIKKTLSETSPDLDQEVDFEGFLKAHLSFQTKAISQIVSAKNAAAFLKASTTTLLHTVNKSEKECYVHHINAYLGDDPFLRQFLPLDPESDDLFRIAKDGVLLCKLINIAVPGTIDERAINTKKILNLWERNENHTLCLNSAKAIGCTVVNIGADDLVEGRTHLVLGLISQIIKIQLLADLNLRRTPQLIELVDDGNELEELMNLSPEKVLLKWMNYHLARAGYEKTVSNFSSDLKDGEAYTYLLNTLAPEHCDPDTLDETDPVEKAKLALDHAERMGCKRYLDSKDVVQGSSNLNLAFIAQIFKIRNGLSVDGRKVAYAEMMTDDVQTSREERCFRFWMNSLGSVTFVNNLFEDLRTGWPLLEALDKIFPGSVLWKQATKPPIKMPFRKVENCNQVINIGKQLNFSLVNVAGNDIVQGNKKLILAFLWQLMRCNMLQLLKNLRSFSHGKEFSDADILNWANGKVRKSCRRSRIESFKDKSLSTGIFFLELLGAVAPRVVNWNLVTKGIKEDEKRLNATYVISVARKIGCCVFLLPEDIMEVNQKMILTLTASIMYWWCLQQEDTSESSPRHSDQAATITDISSNATSESSPRHSDQATTITDISSNATYESSPRHSDQAATTTDISSNATSVFSEDESSISGEISSLTIDDTASSDTTVENVEYD